LIPGPKTSIVWWNIGSCWRSRSWGLWSRSYWLWSRPEARDPWSPVLCHDPMPNLLTCGKCAKDVREGLIRFLRLGRGQFCSCTIFFTPLIAYEFYFKLGGTIFLFTYFVFLYSMNRASAETQGNFFIRSFLAPGWLEKISLGGRGCEQSHVNRVYFLAL